MQIDIIKKNISIGDKYSVLVNGIQSYFASKALFQLLAEISLTKEKGGEAILVINRKFTPFKATYTIQLGESEILDFKTISYWRLAYQCVCGADTYDIYGNRGLKYSIYKNDVQVAYFTEASVTTFKGDSYTLYADDECNKELLIAFCLIVDNYANNDNSKSTININIGNIGIFGLKKFDKDWKPKQGKAINKSKAN